MKPRIAGISFTRSLVYILLIVSYFLLKQHQRSQIMWPHPAPFVPAPGAELAKPRQRHRRCGSENPPVVSVTPRVTLAAGWHLVLLALLHRVTKG